MEILVKVEVTNGDCLCGTVSTSNHIDCQFLDRASLTCQLFKEQLGRRKDKGILKCFECHRKSMEVLNKK